MRTLIPLMMVVAAMPIVLVPPAGADATAGPPARIDVTGDPAFAPVLAWSLAPTEDGRSCQGGSSVKSPILPLGVDSWEAHIDWTACAPVVTYVGITVPKDAIDPPAKVDPPMSHATVTTKDVMRTTTGSETTVNNAQYGYTMDSAYIETSGGWCSTTGGWRLDSCTPDIWNFGPAEPRGAMLASYHSVYWPRDPHNRYAVTGMYPGGAIQGECQESGSLPWARSTTCETRRGTTTP